MKDPRKVRNRFLYFTIAAAVLLGGCNFPKVRPPQDIKTYLLEANVSHEPSAVKTPYCFSIRPCRTAGAFNTKSLVYRTSETEFEKDFYHQLLTTPAEEITQTLTDWITAAGWTTCVPGTAPKDFYTVVPVLDEFYGDFRDSTNPYAVAKMQIALTFTNSTSRSVRTLFSKSYEARTLLPKATVEELITAWARGLEKIFADFQKDAEINLRKS